MGSFRRFPGSWRRLGDVPAERTMAAIAQIVRALRTISDRSAGPGPARFAWEDDGSMLVTTEFPTAVAVRPTDLCVITTSAEGRVSAVLPLHGETPTALATWLGTNAGGSKEPIEAEDPVAFDASDRAALSEAARWLNNASDVLDHLGLAGRLDARTGRFAAALQSGTGEVGLQWAAESFDQDPVRLPAFFATGFAPAFLGRSDLSLSTASGQASRVEAFLSGLAGLTR